MAKARLHLHVCASTASTGWRDRLLQCLLKSSFRSLRREDGLYPFLSLFSGLSQCSRSFCSGERGTHWDCNDIPVTGMLPSPLSSRRVENRSPQKLKPAPILGIKHIHSFTHCSFLHSVFIKIQDTDTENKYMDIKGLKEGGINWETGMNLYTLLILCKIDN